jgi:hypothetical protein
MSKLLENIKKAHQARSIEKKDFSLTELFTGKETETTLKVIGFASKLVEKYKSESNAGFHTMVYLQDGQKTGAFSNALYEFAKFFYEGAGLDADSSFNKVEFPNGHIEVKVSKIDLGKGKTTYNFEIVDGEINGIARMGKLENSAPMLLEAGEVDFE